MKIAIPNKGRLKQPAFEILEKAGYSLAGAERALFFKANGLEVLLANAWDIPMYLEEKIVDLGITGYDVVRELGSDLKELADLEFGDCDLVLAGPEKNKGQEKKQSVRVGTIYANSTAQYFAEQGVAARVIEVKGAVERLPAIGLSDLIVDLRKSGKTLDENGLVVFDTIFSSTARLFARNKKTEYTEFAKKVEAVL